MKYTLDLSIFKQNRNFTLLYTGQLISFFGTMITGVALPYQIYMLTHSTFMVGILSLCQLIPLLLTALIGGVFADRYHRRMLLLFSETVLAIGSLMLALNAGTNNHIGSIFIIAALMSAFNGLHRPALDSIIQQLVKKEDYVTVGSLAGFKNSIGLIAGPAVGGILIANFGIVVTYLADFGTFIISLIALLLMTQIPKPDSTGKDPAIFLLKQGLNYAVSRQELIGSYLVDFSAMVFGMPSALFPAIALSFGGPKVLGMLYSAPAVGALVVTLFSGWAKQITHYGKAIAISAIFWGIAIIFFGLARNFYLALFFLALAGGADGISVIFRKTLWNTTIPNHLRGRMAGIEMISYLSGPKLGDTEAGLIASLFGITVSIVSGGVLCVIAVSACCYFLPKFWHYQAE